MNILFIVMFIFPYYQESFNCGLSMMRGSLRARGIIVTRQRVIDSMSRVDPLSQLLRHRTTTYRREYHVPTPNSLWYVYDICCIVHVSLKSIRVYPSRESYMYILMADVYNSCSLSHRMKKTCI